ncbi:E3 ubiquitin-protein ligase UPL7 isoform X1 [Prosopis cineraria]|uniref:E3 ubiquitin-protein ligase UPL7 isoform X1 n=1 Tax=Prosopis cineraria TaxID=364024 RepID=UPI00240EAB13|nr:E3 ubiquitin-protein ligase UPL7 isoform X1 [Prosopis cineraria]XP_054811325.1 E3 ubiquitin-protein ligase UPL7 isoform X1 [Prosopis cineraria]
MDRSRKHQVSLRGASAKEITRDALLEKVSRERELRNYAKRATAAALFIQRVWRGYKVTRMVAQQLQQEWETLVNHYTGVMTAMWIANNLLRPFLFFISRFSVEHQKIHSKRIDSMRICFTILLESLNSSDSKRNFCSLVTGMPEERRIWSHQARGLISLGFVILSEFSKGIPRDQDITLVTSLAMRVLVMLTDWKGWKGLTDDNRQDADIAVKGLIEYMGSNASGSYVCISRYISSLDNYSSQEKNNSQTDDKFLITASTITLALRPFYLRSSDVRGCALLDVNHAARQYCLYMLTIPWLVKRLPPVLRPALKHKTILFPCFCGILILRENISMEISHLVHLETLASSKAIPAVGWALTNVICLAMGNENESVDHQCFHQGLDHALYVHVVNYLAETLLAHLYNVGWIKKGKKAIQNDVEALTEPMDTILYENEATYDSLLIPYTDQFRPVCQQWHLQNLLAAANRDAADRAETLLPNDLKCLGKLDLSDIALFYSNMVKIYSVLNPIRGSLPVLNMLSFTPGFLVKVWRVLEDSIFHGDNHTSECHISGYSKHNASERRLKHVSKDGSNKWVSVLNKLTGKSQAAMNNAEPISSHPEPSQMNEDSSDVWDIEPMRRGPQGISKETFALLHIFCATYSHLLLVLDDIEFYEKQVPFKLEKQRRIASMLNTLVYNGLSHGVSEQNRPLMDCAIRCLHLMYERNCRHQFCPPDLWLSPARKSRPPIAVAARTHEVSSANLRYDDSLAVPCMGSVITTTPHVFPFEERVEMFREFIRMDKASRKMAGEISEPGSRAIEIVVRRGHIVEDGFRQLNSLGTRLKSSIHVSFVSECGLPEAGLDYGGLSKEFLTDISKAAFAPEYGLFSQTSTSERLLMPNSSARFLDNGLQMIEFLGRVVGKALYEGILLDYSFSHVFVQKLLGRYSFLDELSTLDPELYRNLMYVKHYDGDVKELSLDFTVTEESFGKWHVVELRSGGKDILVTNENKMQYIHAMADYKLNQQILPFSNAFYRGLTDLISPSWLRLFNANEFNQLLSGGKYDIDIDDLKKNTRYTGGYNEGSRTIKIFWEVIKDFEPQERCMLLKFVTSCSRAPLLGFKYLQPTFTIHKVASDVPLWATLGGQDVERLPSASTCYNTLKLPTYKRSSTLRTKLLYAISSNAGFELS